MTSAGTRVQADIGETWLITATWRTEDQEDDVNTPCLCHDRADRVTADVYCGDGVNEWKVDCTGCNSTYRTYNSGGSTFIYDVDVCTVWDCYPYEERSSRYELIVDVA
jgi:hypothetical protein